MQSFRKLTYFIIISLNFIVFKAYSQPPGKSSDTSSVVSKLTSIVTKGITTPNSTNNNTVALNFDLSEVSPDLTVNTSIPGIIKYESANQKKLNKIIGAGKQLEFAKDIDHVYCSSPFDNNITVVFHDATTEQYVLTDQGFINLNQLNQGSAQATTATQQHTFIELDLLNPSNKFVSQEVGNIKCYKPKNSIEIVSKINIGDKNRNVESEVKENFICYTESNQTYKILVAYLNNENQWFKYTLKKSPETEILMDVSLMRTFDEIDLSNIFADHSSPDDDVVFEYKNLKINRNETGVLKSETKGNYKFILVITKQDNTTEKKNINFEKRFKLTEGFTLHSIRSKNNYDQMMFTYANDNIVHHEKFVKQNNVYKKELTAINKYDLKRTKTIIGRENISKENVLFYTTIVPDAVHQEIKISHHGRFKIFNFEKGTDSFVIFPNMEFYLDKNEKHTLVLCENGDSVSFSMRTVTNNKRVDYIITTDTKKGNPLSIKSQIKDFDFTRKEQEKKTVVVPQQTIEDSTDQDITVVEGPRPIATTPQTKEGSEIAVVDQTTPTQVQETTEAAPIATPVARPIATPVATPVSVAVPTPAPKKVAAPVPTPVTTQVATPVSTPVTTQVPTPVQTQVTTTLSTPVSVPEQTQVTTPKEEITTTEQQIDDDDDLTVVEGPMNVHSQATQPQETTVATNNQGKSKSDDEDDEITVVEGPINLQSQATQPQETEKGNSSGEENEDQLNVIEGALT